MMALASALPEMVRPLVMLVRLLVLELPLSSAAAKSKPVGAELGAVVSTVSAKALACTVLLPPLVCCASSE